MHPVAQQIAQGLGAMFATIELQKQAVADRYYQLEGILGGITHYLSLIPLTLERSKDRLSLVYPPSMSWWGALWAMSWWGLLAGGVFSPWIYGQREGWKEGLNHLYCPTYSRGPFIRSVQNIANRYCTECIIGIVQNAGTPSRLRFARTRRDEG